MKRALLHGYIICDSDGRCLPDTLATNRAECWLRYCDSQDWGWEELPQRRRQLKRQGFRAARVRVRDTEIVK